MTRFGEDVPIEALAVSAYTIPTEREEADGTLTWRATTVVVVEPEAGGKKGLGFTYGPTACATLVDETLRGVVTGLDALDVPGAWEAQVRSIRNVGRPGVASMAIAAVDTALWDLKARLMELPLCRLLGRIREEVPVYGSGGFTSYDDGDLHDELSRWVHDEGIPRVKMKIGEDWGKNPERDMARVRHAREIIGPDAELLVDANGGYTRKQAIAIGRELFEEGVSWLEEPVSSDDLEGLHEVRGQVPVEVAAGEYGYDLPYFNRMCVAGAVDVLQADVSRCAGVTEWLRVAAVAAAHGREVSGHTAQSLHLHPATAVPNLRHLEYFRDHARVERLMFDGVAEPAGGCIRPDPSRAGAGLDLRRTDLEEYAR